MNNAGPNGFSGTIDAAALIFFAYIGFDAVSTTSEETKRPGRDLPIGPFYEGAPLGDSLARAKRQYVRTAGPGGFSAFDEKVIEQWTLYGLPFIRVKVPKPIKPAFGTFLKSGG